MAWPSEALSDRLNETVTEGNWPWWLTVSGSIFVPKLATALSVFKHYQGGVAAVRRDWAKTHRYELVGFIRGDLTALDWLYDPDNKAEALQIFQNHLPGTSADIAAQSYDVLLDPVNGFPKRAEIDVEGVKVAMEIRGQYGEPRKILSDPARYYDLTYYQAAIAKP